MRLALVSIALFALACGDESNTPDSGNTPDDSGSGRFDSGGKIDSGTTPHDGGTPDDDSGTTPADGGAHDSGMVAHDSGTPDDDGGVVHHDSGVRMDSGVRPDSGVKPDAGTPANLALAPGDSVTFAEGKVSIGDTFADVQATLGSFAVAPTGNSRGYEWQLGSGPSVTIWFADSDLSQGGVDPTDKVLWIAVGTDFTGRAGNGLSTASTKTQVRGLYGAPDRSVPVTQPTAGELESYFAEGFLIAYNTQGQARTITITRRYTPPDATIDLLNATLAFSPQIKASAFSGSAKSSVTQALGQPDSEGTVSLGGQSLEVLGYAFTGIEVFFTQGGGVLFVSLHAPYYGATSDGIAIGSTRTAFEASISDLGFITPGQPTQANANIICYTDQFGIRGVAAGFAQDGTVGTIIVGYPGLACP